MNFKYDWYASDPMAHPTAIQVRTVTAIRGHFNYFLCNIDYQRLLLYNVLFQKLRNLPLAPSFSLSNLKDTNKFSLYFL